MAGIRYETMELFHHMARRCELDNADLQRHDAILALAFSSSVPTLDDAGGLEVEHVEQAFLDWQLRKTVEVACDRSAGPAEAVVPEGDPCAGD